MTEMIAGLISQVTGIAVANGVICSLVMSLLYLLQTLIFGIAGVYLRLQEDSFSIRDLVQKLKGNG